MLTWRLPCSSSLASILSSRIRRLVRTKTELHRSLHVDLGSHLKPALASCFSFQTLSSQVVEAAICRTWQRQLHARMYKPTLGRDARVPPPKARRYCTVGAFGASTIGATIQALSLFGTRSMDCQLQVWFNDLSLAFLKMASRPRQLKASYQPLYIEARSRAHRCLALVPSIPQCKILCQPFKNQAQTLINKACQ